MLSPDEAEDKFKTERTQRSEPKSTVLKEMELLPNGGEYRGTKFYNTCAFDNVLQALYYLYKYTTFGHDFISFIVTEQAAGDGPGKFLPDILKKITQRDFGQAKALWIQNILGRNISGKVMDFWEEELEIGLKPLKGFFPVVERVQCPTPGCKANKKEPRILDSTYFISSRQCDFMEVLEIGKSKRCKVCKRANARYYFNAKSDHNYGVFAYSHVGFNRQFKETKSSEYEVESEYAVFPESELQLRMEIFGKNFKAVCYSHYNGRHYKLVIVDINGRFIYDGLDKSEALIKWRGADDSFSVSTLWLTPA